MSIDIKNYKINLGEDYEVDLYNIYNVDITPNDDNLEIYEYYNDGIYITKLILSPQKSTKYIVKGINNSFEDVELEFYIHVKMKLSTNQLDINKNDSGFIEIQSDEKLMIYPNNNIQKISNKLYKVNPNISTDYIITNIDKYNEISRQHLKVTVSNNIIFNPENPKVYSGNRLILNAELNYNEKIDYTFKWRSTHSIGLPEQYAGIKYGNSITIYPYFSLGYIVEAITNNGKFLTSNRIDINVIPKPVNILDNDIIPEILYESVINRNSKKVKELLLQNTRLLNKIITFYYNTITNAYKLENNNKTGSQVKVPWISNYSIVNDNNDMIVTFDQLWNLYIYINRYKTNSMKYISNFAFLLKNVNDLINTQRYNCIN